jgi:hypothetical protein
LRSLFRTAVAFRTRTEMHGYGHFISCWKPFRICVGAHGSGAYCCPCAHQPSALQVARKHRFR